MYVRILPAFRFHFPKLAKSLFYFFQATPAVLYSSERTRLIYGITQARFRTGFNRVQIFH